MSERAAALTGAAWDLGACVVVYYALRLAGVDERTALLVATVLAAGRLVWVAVRGRQVTWFAAVMLAVFGIGLLWTLATGDVRALLLKESVVTAGVGTVFLLSAVWGRPLTLSAAQTSRPGRADALAGLYRTRADVRRRFVVSALVWGAGLLIEAAVRVPLVATLPVDVMVGLGELMFWGTIAVLTAWNLVYTYPVWREVDRDPHRPAGDGAAAIIG